MANQAETGKENVVLGRVTDKLARPLANLLVQAYDRDMRSEELLGECVTDRDGKYAIAWSARQAEANEKGRADISIKVVTRERKTLLFASDVDATRFNASPREEIDVTIEKMPVPEAVEYDHIVKEISSLAGDVAIRDLQESEKHRDITFLSKETEIPAEKIEHVVVAHRVQAESKIDAAFFYALLRRNTLLKSDPAKPFQARLSVDINAETLPLLYDASLVDEKIIRNDVEAATKEMIVSADVQHGIDKNLQLLRAYRQRAEDFSRNERPKKLMRIVSRFVLEDKIAEMGRLFEENKNDPAAFLAKINSQSFFETDANASERQGVARFGAVAGLRRERPGADIGVARDHQTRGREEAGQVEHDRLEDGAGQAVRRSLREATGGKHRRPARFVHGQENGEGVSDSQLRRAVGKGEGAGPEHNRRRSTPSCPSTKTSISCAMTYPRT